MNFLSGLTNSTVQQITSIEIVLNLVLAFILGIAVSIVYRLTNRNKAINQSFMLTMVILGMVVALVMMVIGNSIARAFSLVGALSIIRFRTVVKDNRDIAYVFFSLAAGMSAGIGNYPIAVYGVGTICILLLILDFIQFGTAPKGVYLLRFQLIPTDTDDTSYLSVMDRLLVSHTRLAVKTVRMGQYVEHVYLVKLKRGKSDQVLISELSAIEGMDRVTLIIEEGEVGA